MVSCPGIKLCCVNANFHWYRDKLQYDGKPWRQHLKEVAYKEAIPEFKGVLAQIGKFQGWEILDIKARFSNELLDYLFFL